MAEAPFLGRFHVLHEEVCRPVRLLRFRPGQLGDDKVPCDHSHSLRSEWGSRQSYATRASRVRSAREKRDSYCGGEVTQRTLWRFSGDSKVPLAN